MPRTRIALRSGHRTCETAQAALAIGIASGEVIAGYTGTQQRATYTCVGDTVNLAARLEAHTKAAGRGVLLDGDTAVALDPGVALEALAAVQFKGKAAAVPVFALAARAGGGTGGSTGGTGV